MWPVSRIALFLLKLALLVPLLFWTWGLVQPWYTGLITFLADGAITLEEWDVKVTHLTLTPAGDVIEVRTPLRGDGEPANTYQAHTLHFYLVPALAVVLAFPGLGWWSRTRAFVITLGLVVIFQTIALVVTVEHTYAVILAEIARRNYSPLEQRIYTWLYEAFAFIAIQGVPAATVIFLVAWHGPLGRGRRPPVAAGPSGGSDDALAGSGRPGSAGLPATHEGEEPTSASPGSGHQPEGAAAGAAGSAPGAPAAADGMEAPGRRAAAVPRPAVRVAAGLLLALGGATLASGAWMHHGKVVRRKAETLCVWGQRALAMEDLEKAREFFAKSAGLNDRFDSAHAGLGATLLRVGEYTAAAGAYGEAIRLNPGVARSHAGLGESLARNQDFAGAAQALGEAIRLDPSVSAWHGQLATALVMAGRQAEAEEVFRSAIERWPGEPSHHLNLSLLLYRAGRLCEAIPHLETFLRLTPEDPAAAVVSQTLAYAQPRCPPR